MKKLILFLFFPLILNAQSWFAPNLWKLDGTTVTPAVETWTFNLTANGTAAAPAFAIDGTTGFYLSAAGTFKFASAGSNRWILNNVQMGCQLSTGTRIVYDSPTATTPTLIMRANDSNTGLGWVEADVGALIAGGSTAGTWSTNGIEAGTTSAQGVIINSPNGTNWMIKVANDGTVSADSTGLN